MDARGAWQTVAARRTMETKTGSGGRAVLPETSGASPDSEVARLIVIGWI